jgi:arylamine N-acetyltransferase
VTSFFVSSTKDDGIYYIANDDYVIKKRDGTVAKSKLSTLNELMELLTTVFNLELPRDMVEGHLIGRYLTGNHQPIALTGDDRLDKKYYQGYMDRLNLQHINWKRIVPTIEMLTTIFNSHIQNIPLDSDSSMKKDDSDLISLHCNQIASKLIDAKKGGCSFEHNRLLQLMLDNFGYKVVPLLCKVDDDDDDDDDDNSDEEKDACLTHMVLKVSCFVEESSSKRGASDDDDDECNEYLVDVGFGDSIRSIPSPLKFIPFFQQQQCLRSTRENNKNVSYRIIPCTRGGVSIAASAAVAVSAITSAVPGGGGLMTAEEREMNQKSRDIIVSESSTKEKKNQTSSLLSRRSYSMLQYKSKDNDDDDDDDDDDDGNWKRIFSFENEQDTCFVDLEASHWYTSSNSKVFSF